jgi:hypothetical protein
MDPYTWVYLIIALAVSIALAPKPPKPRPASLDDFDIPTAEEGRPVPVVFGTVRVTGPNVLWYGSLKAKAMKKKSLFSSTTIGYKYYIGFHFGICHGPIDAITRIDVGDKNAWTGSVTSNSTIQISQPKLFGGTKREGGITGGFDACFGGPTQTPNDFLEAQIGTPQPAYRGVFGIVAHSQLWPETVDPFFGNPIPVGCYIGTSAYAKPFAFTVKRIAKGWLNDSVWYSAKAAIGSGMNPAHIIYQTLTDTEWGMGLPADRLDATSFTEAADLLYSEGFGLSLMWNQQTTIEDFLSEVINHISAALAFDRTTGKYRIKLIRGDYDAGTLPVYGPETISRVTSYSRQGWGETVNELTLGFTDGTTLKDTSVTVHDLANVKAQGVRVATKVDFPGITDAVIAQKVAIRELGARSTPLGKITFTVNRDLWATKKADVFKISWPALGIAEIVVRVLRIRQGTLANGELEVEAVEDIYAQALAIYTSQPAPGTPPADTTVDEENDSSGPSVVSSTLTAPPGSPADGASYLVPTGATGAWAGHVGEVATWDEEDAAWIFSTVVPGTVVTDTSTGTQVQTVTGGTAVPYTPIQTSGKVIFGTSISPAALGADVNDYSPTGLLTSSGVRVSATGVARNITGLAAGAGGQLLLLHNVGTLAVILKDESASSTAANRFALNADVTLNADQSTLLQYDATSSRWRVIGGTGSGGGSSSPTTTKGDLIVRGASVDERLPVGLPGQFITPDPAASGGIKWANQTPSIAPDDGAEVVNNGAAQNLADSVEVAITFDTEVRDDAGYANLGTNNDRLTVTRSGWYAITGSMGFSPNVTNLRRLSIQVNAGATRYGMQGAGGFSASISFLHTTAELYLAAGDYVRMIAYQNSGSTLTTATTVSLPRLQIHRLGTTVVLNDPGVLHVRDEKASGTFGGASSAGVQTRTLNTTVLNTITGASLASNQITLPAGTYDVFARAPGHQCEGHQAYLYNVTDAAIALLGTTARSRQTSSTDGSNDSVVMGQITITSTKVFELRHYTANAQATNGLGSAAASGNVEVYASLLVRVVAGTAPRKIIRGAQWFAASGNLSTAVNKVSVHFPRAATIKASRLLGGTAAGSCVVNIYKNTFAGWGGGSDGSSIVASAKPTLSSARTAADTTLTGWTTAVNAGDVLTFQIESISNLTNLSLQLELDEAQT